MRSLFPTVAPAFLLVAVVALMASPSASFTWGGAGAAAAPAPVAAPATHASPVPAVAGRAPVGAHPHPLITCPPPPGFGYGQVGGEWPLTPKQSSQSPCNYVEQDGIHGSLFSNAPGSGERFTVPLKLPSDGMYGPGYSFGGVYVGDVVTGDPTTDYRQSYVEASFDPVYHGKFGFNYSVRVAVWSFVNDTKVGGNDSCPKGGLPLSWNNTWYCEMEVVNGGSSFYYGELTPGQWVNVTYAGVKGRIHQPLHLWVNTTRGSLVDHVFDNRSDDNGSKGLTGEFNLTPYFNESCPINCVLNWSMPLGDGVGLDVCPTAPSTFSACSSYNQYTWAGDPPIEFGAPEFWQNGSYSGDYYYLGPSSESGVCNPNVNPGLVSVCYNYGSNGGTGYYPVFSFNGTHLNFGTTWPWTVTDFGGTTFQYLSNGAPTLQVPFVADQVANDSRGGFIAPSTGLNVTARLSDLGTVTGGTLVYRVGSGTATSVAMTRVSGDAHEGVYRAAIPAAGGNGLISYWVNATNHAGASVHNGTASRPFYVLRGPLPHFGVTLTTLPRSCGSIWFNGSHYSNGQTVTTLPGTFAVTGIACYPYIFGNWTTTPGITAYPDLSARTNVTVSANGTLTQTLVYIRPHDTVTIETNPSTCGSIDLNGTVLSSGNTLSLYDGIPVSLAVGSACSQDGSFAGWNFTGNFSILGPVFTPNGNGTLYANFVPSGSADSLIFYTSPTNCGGVLFRGAGYTNGESLNVLPGTYDLGAQACPHWAFRNFSSSTPGVTTTNTTVTVKSGGWVRATDYHLTEVYVATNPAACGTVTIDGASYTNGALDVVANNSTHTISASSCANYYFFGFNTTGGLHVFGSVLVANGSGTLLAVFAPGQPQSFVGFVTDPATCGGIQFNANGKSVIFHDSNYTFVSPGDIATVTGLPCANYGFVRWMTTGGITIVGNTAYLNGTGGSIEAVFRPLVNVFVYTSPANCGSVVLNGVSYSGSGVVQLPMDAPFSLVAVPCAHYSLTQWLNSSSAIISRNQVFLTGAAIITAQFNQVVYSVSVTTDPANCGAIKIGRAQLQNGSSIGLTYGTYGILPVLCLGDHLDHWSVAGNLTISGTSLTVNGSGSIRGVYRPTPPSVKLVVPSSSYAGDAVDLLAEVAVPVPPFNYTYTWTFGDGETSVTPGNTTSHVYASPGTYTATVTILDPYHRSANQSATVTIVRSSGLSAAGIPIWSVYVAGGVLGVVLVAIAVGLVLRARPPKREDDGGAGAPAGGAASPSLDEPATASLPPLESPPSEGPEA